MLILKLRLFLKDLLPEFEGAKYSFNKEATWA